MSLRAIPGLVTIRPCDANEVAEAWRYTLALRHVPVALVLSRQALPTLDRTRYAPASGLARGAYVLADASGGGEVHAVVAGPSGVGATAAQLGAHGADVVYVADTAKIGIAQPIPNRSSTTPKQRHPAA